MTVEPSPPDTTSAPWAAAPCPNASASSGEDVRMSCTVTTARAPVSRANAAPTASATPSSSSSGTVPRMSYALKIFAYSATLTLALPTLAALSTPRRPPPFPRRARRTEPTGRGLATLAELAPRQGVEGGSSPLGLAQPPGIPRRGAQNSQMAPPPDLDALPDVLARRARRRRLHDRIGHRLQVVLLLLGGAVRKPEHLPAPRHGHPVGVRGAKVVAVRLNVGGERAEDRGGVAVDVGERVYGGPLARGPTAATRRQPAASFTTPPRGGGARPAGGRLHTSLTTADGIDLRAVTPSPGALCAIVSPVRLSRTSPVRIRSVTVDDGGGRPPGGQRAVRIRRRDSHGRGLRGSLTPPEVPLYRSRAQRFDDLVLEAVAQLEPRWEAELASVEVAVEEIPAADPPDDDPEPVPLAR